MESFVSPYFLKVYLQFSIYRSFIMLTTVFFVLHRFFKCLHLAGLGHRRPAAATHDDACISHYPGVMLLGCQPQGLPRAQGWTAAPPSSASTG
jgi:hypothetical protein